MFSRKITTTDGIKAILNRKINMKKTNQRNNNPFPEVELREQASGEMTDFETVSDEVPPLIDLQAMRKELHGNLSNRNELLTSWEELKKK